MSYFNSPIAYIFIGVFLIVGQLVILQYFFLIGQATIRNYFALLLGFSCFYRRLSP